MTDFQKMSQRQREAGRRTLEFFETLDLAAVKPALNAAEQMWAPRDSVYRIFHHSWKMYGLRADAIELVSLMLSPLGWNPAPDDVCEPSGLVAQLRRWNLHETFVETIERTTKTVSSKERNAIELWREDAQQLVAGAMLTHEVATATLVAMDRMTRGEGFLFQPQEALDSTDALFLEVWTGVGDGLRYWLSENKGLEGKCRKILRSRGGTAK